MIKTKNFISTDMCYSYEYIKLNIVSKPRTDICINIYIKNNAVNNTNIPVQRDRKSVV